MKIAPKPPQRKSNPTLKGPTVRTDRPKTTATLASTSSAHRVSDAFEARRPRHPPRHGPHTVDISYKGPVIKTGTSSC
jgi:hypothetical protein